MPSAVVTLTSPRVIHVIVTDDTVSVDLEDGRTIAVPIVWYPRLARHLNPHPIPPPSEERGQGRGDTRWAPGALVLAARPGRKYRQQGRHHRLRNEGWGWRTQFDLNANERFVKYEHPNLVFPRCH